MPKIPPFQNVLPHLDPGRLFVVFVQTGLVVWTGQHGMDQTVVCPRPSDDMDRMYRVCSMYVAR